MFYPTKQPFLLNFQSEVKLSPNPRIEFSNTRMSAQLECCNLMLKYHVFDPIVYPQAYSLYTLPLFCCQAELFLNDELVILNVLEFDYDQLKQQFSIWATKSSRTRTWDGGYWSNL